MHQSSIRESPQFLSRGWALLTRFSPRRASAAGWGACGLVCLELGGVGEGFAVGDSVYAGAVGKCDVAVSGLGEV